MHGPATTTTRTDDAVERNLVAHVHPPTWRNPQPAPVYDLVVIGGGTAGLVSAMGAAGLGARVALVERHLLGGDCLNTGCVPSKALLRSSRAVGELRRAGALGVIAGEARVDFPALMRRMRERRALLAANDSAARLQRAGIDVFFGNAQFRDARSVIIGETRLRFNRAVVATGGRAAAPQVPGLSAVPYYTNETIFTLTELPRRLLIIGAGPIGCELGQAFARFGSIVTMFAQDERVLPRDAPDAAAIVQKHLHADGVRLELGVRLARITSQSGTFTVRSGRGERAGVPETLIEGDAILVAAGRAPNVEGLQLDAAGIETSQQGIVVDQRCRTTNPRVFASGDVCSRFKFTHAADATSRLVVQNALFFGRRKASALVIPWVTYTDPEVAHVGVTHADAVSSAGRLATITIPMLEIDRAVLDEAADGFVQVHHERGRLRGCSIVAPHAGEMIAEVVYAMSHGGTLADLSAIVHPYPTYAEALRKAGDTYRRQALTPRVGRWLERYFRWTR